MKNAVAASIALALATPLQAEERRSVAPKNMQAIAPGLADYTDRVLFGDVWEREQLSPRDRSLMTLSVLVATGKTAQLTGHLGRGLTNGIQPTEVAGLVTQLAFYTGWPNAVSALNVVEQVFIERKIDFGSLQSPANAKAPLPASDAERAAAVAERLAPSAPKLAQLTNEVIFDDLWRRTDLSPRDRSLVTISALAANGDTEQLEFHIRRGVENGLTQQHLTEALTHLAFYAGWPKASSAIAVSAKAFAEEQKPAADEKAVQLFPPGQNPTSGPAANFTGSVVVTSRFQGSGGARLAGATVAFQPGARTNWHSHPLGQLLIVTHGNGLVQAEGEPARRVKPGDVVWTRPGIRHWHGGSAGSGMTHVAVAEGLEGQSVMWLEPVTDSEYQAARK